MIIAETEDELRMKLIKWKTILEVKGLRVNMRKTKIMVSRVNLKMLKDSGKYRCSDCRKVLAVTPSTVLDACIGFTRNAVVLLAG